MSKREDITGSEQCNYIQSRKFGLVYTDNLGWIDLGHANPEGAMALWQQMINPRYTNGDFFRVSYGQSMSKKFIKRFDASRLITTVSRHYEVKRNLHHEQLVGIAYAIFLSVSYEFEALQHRFPYSLLTDSGFSVEDLISNVVGFHSAVYRKNHLQQLKIRDRDYALKIWDYYGPPGSIKNKELMPVLFPDPEDTSNPRFPYRIPLPDCLARLKPITDKKLVREIL